MKRIKISIKLKPQFLTKLFNDELYLKPFIFFIAFALLSAAIWFGGPLVAWNDYVPLASADKRFYVMAALFLIWLLKFLIIDLGTPNPFHLRDNATRKKLQPLQNQFQGAMQFLKKTFITKHHHQVRLNQLPWYLLIGPEQAGKTSLLANSTVNFILQRQFQHQSTKNFVASENCNWWVTRDTSIIDVPGKYISPTDKNAPQPPFWKFLLRLVKKQRGKNGIDGIVIALPFPEILAEEDTKQYQLLIRQLFHRLAELQKLFPKPLPCYLLITKCDLLPGFTEYFAELGNDEISQAWGVMLPEPEQNETTYDLFSLRFNALIKKLNQQLIWRLHQERNPTNRPAIKDFPLHVERLKEFTCDFIKKLSHARFRLSLQGVYLTSAVQTPKESPLHLLNDHSQSNRAIQLFKEPIPATRAYFIKQFITHGLISAQAELTPLTKRQIWKRRAAYAASFFAIGLTALLLGRDFKTGVNKAYAIQHNLTEYRLSIQAFQNPDEHLIKTIALLDTLQKSIKHVGFKLDLAHLLSFYSNKSQEKASLVYEEALQTILLPEIRKYLEDFLALPINKNYDALYAVLKAYLMLGDLTQLQPDILLGTVQSLLPKTMNQADAEHLMSHLSAALNNINTAQPLNAEIVQKTRGYLTTIPAVQLSYIILKNINSNETESEVNLGIHSAKNVALTSPPLADQLPSMFTAKSLSNILNREINEAATDTIKGNWILGYNPNANPEAILPLVNELRNVYISHYIQAWENLIDNIHLASAKDLAETDAMILNLTSTESPLLQLLETLHNNTYFEPITTVSPKLESLGLLIDKNNQAGNLLFQIFSGLRFMHQYLQPIISAQNPQKAAFEALSYRVAHNDKPDALIQIRIIADRSPEPIKSWLNQLSNTAWHLLMYDASSYLNTAWEDQIIRPYRAEIANRYPFSPTSSQEVNLQQFTLFFGNQGLVANFYRNFLQPFIDTSKPEWQWKMNGNEKLPFSDDCLRQIQQAQRIQHTFYPNGDNKLFVQFSMEPFHFGKTVKRVQLTINDKQIVDEDAKIHSPHVITWPSAGKLKMTSLQLTLQNKQTIQRQFPGEWGWFKLVNQAFENFITKKQTLLNLSMNEVPVKYYLYTDGQVNPFLSLNLKHFNLPDQLIRTPAHAD